MPSLYFADLPNAARLGKVLGGELGGVGGRGAAHLLHHLLLLHEHLLDLLHLLVQLIQVHLQWTIGHVVRAQRWLSDIHHCTS